MDDHITAPFIAPIPFKQRHTNIAPLVEQVSSYAYQHGLPNPLISRIITLTIRCNKTIDQASLTRLFKNLYPCEHVSPRIITRVVGSLGASKTKPPPAIQYLLAHWLVSVYEVLESQAHITRFYSVLFDCLDLLSIRRPICHLLCYLTRRRHVTPARVRILWELIRSTADDEKELSELLRVFKSYYPDIILGDLNIPRRRAVFKPLNSEWFEHTRELMAKYNSDSSGNARSSDLARSYKVDRGSRKRSKIEVVIPVLKTAYAQRAVPSSRGLKDLRSVEDFVWNFDRIELPCQVISILRDPSAMRYLQLVENDTARRRLETWLEAAFDNGIEIVQDAGGRFSDNILGLLEAVLEFARFTKALPKSAQSFIKRLSSLAIEDKDRERIFELMPYVGIQSQEQLSDLTQFESFIRNANPRPRVHVINYLSSIIRYWSSLIRSGTKSQSEPPLLQLVEKTEGLVFAISESFSAASPADRTLLSLSILQFYRTLAEIYAHAPTTPGIRLTVPPAPLIYQIAFTPTLTHISSLSSILSRYKISFEGCVAAHKQGKGIEGLPERWPDPYPTAMVSQFNGYVMDTCNLLWRNRALNDDDPNAVGCNIPRATVEEYKKYLEALSSAGQGRNLTGGSLDDKCDLSGLLERGAEGGEDENWE
ncbi:hypothetical protein KEM54_001514 [Ascosphaera aggregata]|nr:hypothetical protein KEM54_001514 [Ascosphaera aggregata]